ncbi:hypothetical protein ACJQWK_08577 [Exserohilum turcicum]
MSLEISPCTPTGGQKRSAVNRSSRRSTLATASESPFTLEVVDHAFYFAMELSPRKNTPTKDAMPTVTLAPSILKSRTPVNRSHTKAPLDTPTKVITLNQDLKASSPMKKTPIRRKRRSLPKQTPNRTLFQTPSQDNQQSTPSDSRPSSPVKRTIELDSPSAPVDVDLKLVRRLASQPEDIFQTLSERLADVAMQDDPEVTFNTPLIPVPSEGFIHVRKTRKAAMPQPENIGHLMAKLGSNSTTPNQECVYEEGVKGGAASPTPTPLRKAWEKLQLADSLSFRRISNNIKVASGISQAVERALEHTTDTQLGRQSTSTLSSSSAGSFLAPDEEERADTMGFLPLHYPKPSLKRMQGDTRADSANYVDWQNGGDGTLHTSKAQSASFYKQAGVNYSLLLRPKDNGFFQTALHDSFSNLNPAFCQSPDLSELPPIPDTHCIRGQEDVKGPSTVETPEKICRAKYAMPSLASMAMGSPNGVSLPKVPSTPIVPRSRPIRITPSPKKMNLLIINRRPDVTDAAADGTKLARLKSPAKALAFAKPPSTPVKQTTPFSKRTPPKSTSRIPLATPAMLKRYNTATPHGTPKYLSGEPVSKPAPTLKSESSPLKLSRATITATPKKPLHSAKSEPQNPSAETRAPQLKYASALAIKWHSADPKKAAKTANRTTSTAKAARPSNKKRPTGIPAKIKETAHALTNPEHQRITPTGIEHRHTTTTTTTTLTHQTKHPAPENQNLNRGTDTRCDVPASHFHFSTTLHNDACDY